MTPGSRTSSAPFDSVHAERLAHRILAGDRGAFDELLGLLWNEWLAIVARSRAMGPLARSEDDVRNVVTRLLEKVKKDDFHTLALYPPWRERHPEKSFSDWMRIVATNAVRDYVRERRGGAPDPARKDPTPTRLLDEFAQSLAEGDLAARPPMTAAQTARQLIDFARTRLPPEQMRALSEWLEGASFDEIGDALELGDPADAKRLVRAAIASLRREFT